MKRNLPYHTVIPKENGFVLLCTKIFWSYMVKLFNYAVFVTPVSFLNALEGSVMHLSCSIKLFSSISVKITHTHGHCL